MRIAHARSGGNRGDAASPVDRVLKPVHGLDSFPRKGCVSSSKTVNRKKVRSVRRPAYTAPMAKHPGEYIGAVLTRVMDERGISISELAERAKVSYTHIVNLRNNNKRASLDIIKRLAPHLGLLVGEMIVNGSPTLGEAAAQVDRHGLLTMLGDDLPMFAQLVIAEACFDWRPGDLLQYRPGDYEPGRYLLVDGIEGRLALARAVSTDGHQWLETGRGDLLMFRPEAHTVRGVIVRSIREH